MAKKFFKYYYFMRNMDHSIGFQEKRNSLLTITLNPDSRMYLAGVDSRESSFISAKKLSCWLLIL
jgi:hypothetical protein